jgi:uncharacterized membrane protein
MSDAKETARVEMFSDGVFAIAITLFFALPPKLTNRTSD